MKDNVFNTPFEISCVVSTRTLILHEAVLSAQGNNDRVELRVPDKQQGSNARLMLTQTCLSSGIKHKAHMTAVCVCWGLFVE